MNKIEVISEIMKQYRWELDSQTFFHKRFFYCKKCKSLKEQLKKLTIELKRQFKGTKE